MQQDPVSGVYPAAVFHVVEPLVDGQRQSSEGFARGVITEGIGEHGPQADEGKRRLGTQPVPQRQVDHLEVAQPVEVAVAQHEGRRSDLGEQAGGGESLGVFDQRAVQQLHRATTTQQVFGPQHFDQYGGLAGLLGQAIPEQRQPRQALTNGLLHLTLRGVLPQAHRNDFHLLQLGTRTPQQQLDGALGRLDVAVLVGGLGVAQVQAHGRTVLLGPGLVVEQLDARFEVGARGAKGDRCLGFAAGSQVERCQQRALAGGIDEAAPGVEVLHHIHEVIIALGGIQALQHHPPDAQVQPRALGGRDRVVDRLLQPVVRKPVGRPEVGEPAHVEVAFVGGQDYFAFERGPQLRGQRAGRAAGDPGQAAQLEGVAEASRPAQQGPAFRIEHPQLAREQIDHLPRGFEGGHPRGIPLPAARPVVEADVAVGVQGFEQLVEVKGIARRAPVDQGGQLGRIGRGAVQGIGQQTPRLGRV